MAGQHVGVEAGLGHVAGDNGADLRRLDLGLRDGGAGGLDAEIDGGDGGERAVEVGERGALAVEQPRIVPGGGDGAGHGAVPSPLEGQGRGEGLGTTPLAGCPPPPPAPPSREGEKRTSFMGVAPKAMTWGGGGSA